MKNRPEIKYVELKTGFSHGGPAWIGIVSYSKSGRTLYFNGKALQSLKGTGITANYFDIESGDEYWVSGVKKNLQDRHEFGSGMIQVERRIKDEYMKCVGINELDSRYFEVVDLVEELPIERIFELENEKDDFIDYDDLRFKKPNELSNEELKIVIEDLFEREVGTNYNKARRSMKRARVEFQIELEKREVL